MIPEKLETVEYSFGWKVIAHFPAGRKQIGKAAFGDVLIRGLDKEPAEEICRRYNAHEDLLATIQNALVSLQIIKMPRGVNVTSNEDILRIVEESFKIAISKAEAKP